jgi:hypothetical protein
MATWTIRARRCVGAALGLGLLLSAAMPVRADSGPADGCAKGSEDEGFWQRGQRRPIRTPHSSRRLRVTGKTYPRPRL